VANRADPAGPYEHIGDDMARPGSTQKNAAHLLGSAEMKFRLIEDQRDTFPVRAETPWIHWLTFSYLMKGYDRGVIVQSAPHSPDGLGVYLGDLIAWPWHDPGLVPWRRRCGWSRSLGPDRRAVGVPGGLDYLLRKGELRVTPDSVPVSIIGRPYPAFRSWYEDGCRDVRQLYPAEFYDKITKLPRLPYSSSNG
jgi:hypothetical protein